MTADVALKKARYHHRLEQSAIRKLKRFSLWKRILFYSRFKKLRERRSHHNWMRFAAMATALHLVRLTKAKNRKYKNLKVIK
ncbi:MAG: hypothetical protein H7831_14685 [Magnetococcus sp. WYHC-3]